MKYIAYGSNMVEEQMAVRCPEARLIGTGYISGARLEFYLHATVEKTGDKRNRVPERKRLPLRQARPKLPVKRKTDPG